MAQKETKNYTLGRGDLYFAERRANGTLAGERIIGNTPSFMLSASTESVKHYNSSRGMRVQDREVPIQTDYSGKFETDDVNAPNLSILFLGEYGTTSVSSATAVVETFTAVEQGLEYQLGMSAAHPAGVQKISNVIVKVGVTTKTVNTDYKVDADLGRVTIVVGGTIADAATIEVTYDRAAQSQERVVSGTNPVEGALRFVAHNPEGDDKDYYMPDVKLTPNGDFAIKTDSDWQKMAFNVSIQTPVDRPAVNVNGRAFTA